MKIIPMLQKARCSRCKTTTKDASMCEICTEVCSLTKDCYVEATCKVQKFLNPKSMFKIISVLHVCIANKLYMMFESMPCCEFHAASFACGNTRCRVPCGGICQQACSVSMVQCLVPAQLCHCGEDLRAKMTGKFVRVHLHPPSLSTLAVQDFSDDLISVGIVRACDVMQDIIRRQ